MNQITDPIIDEEENEGDDSDLQLSDQPTLIDTLEFATERIIEGIKGLS